jgi:hypothetical protein
VWSRPRRGERSESGITGKDSLVASSKALHRSIVSSWDGRSRTHTSHARKPGHERRRGHHSQCALNKKRSATIARQCSGHTPERISLSCRRCRLTSPSKRSILARRFDSQDQLLVPNPDEHRVPPYLLRHEIGINKHPIRRSEATRVLNQPVTDGLGPVQTEAKHTLGRAPRRAIGAPTRGGE